MTRPIDMSAAADRPHVMHLLATFDVGGAESVALNLARAMNGDRFRVGACALDGRGGMRGRFAEAGIRTEFVWPADAPAGLTIRTLWRLAGLLRRRGVDVLHSHNKRAHVYGVLAARLAGVPVTVCTRHGVGSGGREFDAGAMERFAARLASQHVAVCRAALKEGIRVGRIRADRGAVIYNGIDTGRFACDRRSEPAANSAVTLGCVARLSEEKGHAVLLKAMRNLADRRAPVRARLVGDGPERDRLMRMAHDLGIDGQVEFLGTRNDVPELLRSFDVFVLPSLTEGMPLTLVEAMAAGLPVIATDVGGVSEVVKHGESGLLVPPDAPDALADAIGQLLDDAGLRARMGAAGRKSAVEQFDLALMARKHAELYLDLLMKKGVGRETAG